jgi:hypothetical protein
VLQAHPSISADLFPALLPQIWEECHRGQVLKVEPFKPWEEQAAQDVELAGAPTPQVRCAPGLCNLPAVRSHLPVVEFAEST